MVLAKSEVQSRDIVPVIHIGIDGCRNLRIRSHISPVLRTMIGNEIQIETFVRREEDSRGPRYFTVAGRQRQGAYRVEELPRAGSRGIAHLCSLTYSCAAARRPSA